MSIEVQAVSKIYGEQKALDEVSFSIAEGEIVGFLGPNGAGKSTMMKILTGYLPQSTGKASVCGIDLEEDRIEVRRKVGYLPEHNPLYLEMYVREFLHFSAGVQGQGKERIDAVIEQVGLEKEKQKKLSQLSKGYRQRAGLAAAILHDPQVLILDEPTTGLDPNQIVQIRDLIRDMGQDKTVMLSTHIMQEVEILCDRVIIVNRGKIVADRSTSDLKKFYEGSDFLVEFDGPVSASQLRKLAGVKKAEVLDQNDQRWRLSTDGSEGVREAVFQQAVKAGRVVLEIKKEEKRLEQIFQQLTDQA